jgi:hypothetical protein
MSTDDRNMPNDKVDLKTDRSFKSMENPISAIFDLSESVNSQVPRIKKMIQYTGVFVVVWLSINFVLLLMVMAQGALILFLILLLFLIMGFGGLYLMYNISKFFNYFSMRHLAIKLIRDADELVYVPKGRDSIHSYLSHLAKANPRFDDALRSHPNMVHTPALLTGAMGVSYNFDGYIFRPPSSSWKMFGTGDPGYALFIKAFDHSPHLGEIQAIEKAVQDITVRTKVMPSRIVALVEKKAGAKIDDEVYEHVTTKRPIIHVGRQKCVVNLQIVSIDEDDTYDFVPVIAEIGGELP